MKVFNSIITAIAVFAAGAAVGVLSSGAESPALAPRLTGHQQTAMGRSESIYIVNRDRKDLPNKLIRRYIPAWEKAANGAFARVWGTAQVRILLVKKAPQKGIAAFFIKKGRIADALAYHTVAKGQPHIVVYSGTNRYYDFNISVSFTHELFEMLGDQSTAALNVGYPEPMVWIGNHPHRLQFPVAWVNEVCDPVERYSYRVKGVPISDWITPNWFNDGVSGGLDYMGVATQPLQILKGGYALVWYDGKYAAITNFQNAGRDAAGFYKAERPEMKQ